MTTKLLYLSSVLAICLLGCNMSRSSNDGGEVQSQVAKGGAQTLQVSYNTTDNYTFGCLFVTPGNHDTEYFKKHAIKPRFPKAFKFSDVDKVLSKRIALAEDTQRQFDKAGDSERALEAYKFRGAIQGASYILFNSGIDAKSDHPSRETVNPLEIEILIDAYQTLQNEGKFIPLTCKDSSAEFKRE